MLNGQSNSQNLNVTEEIIHYSLFLQLLEECCLSPSGSVAMAGSRVGLTPEPGNQVHLWSITPEGFVRYTPTSDLVLEVKGEHPYVAWNIRIFRENNSTPCIIRHIVLVIGIEDLG